MKWVLRGVLALVALGFLAFAVIVGPAHVQIRSITPEIPDRNALRSLLDVENGPTHIHLIRSSEQSVPDFDLGHTSIAIEWADGRIFLIDAAMDEPATIEFAELIALMGGERGELKFHGTIAEQLGPAVERVAGIGFTHLHIDHVQGIGALCEARGQGARVFRTRWQAEDHNLHTEESAALVEESCFEPVTLDGEGLLLVPGFPGLAIAGLGGHTPGSTLFAVVANGKLWLMSGDITNSKQDLRRDTGKGFVYSGLLVPENTNHTGKLRRWLTGLDTHPKMEVIVSHDVGAALASGLRDFEPAAH